MNLRLKEDEANLNRMISERALEMFKDSNIQIEYVENKSIHLIKTENSQRQGTPADTLKDYDRETQNIL